MSKFQVLVGKALVSAIAGREKAVATFTAREHQLAYSALNHVELHNDPKYLNALLAGTPANYRKGLIAWATAYGKVSYDVKESAFAFAKGKKSDMPAAMEVAPANYAKEAGKAKPKADFDEVKYLERVVAKMEEEGASVRVLQAVKGALTLAKMPAVEVVAPAKVAKPAKVKAAKVATPAQAEMPLAAAA